MFMKLFKTSVHMPGLDSAGNAVVETKQYTFSMWTNLVDAGLTPLAVVLLVCTAASVALAILSLFFGNVKAISLGGKVVFVVSLIVFVISFILASKVGRCF